MNNNNAPAAVTLAPSKISDKNVKDTKGNIYKGAGYDKDGVRITLCPTTGRRAIARIVVINGGFVLKHLDDRAIQQYNWTARGGREGLQKAIAYLAKDALTRIFAGKYGDKGYVRIQHDSDLPSATWEAWGFTRENAAMGSVSIEVPCFDILVDHT